jgi:signal transduction histidine kinase
MKVVAALGFVEERRGIEYLAGKGRTGECAQKGLAERFDEIREPIKQGFDSAYFGSLERGFGKSIQSWMAIPIGKKNDNHGVIKVVNRISPWNWFTDEDQQLAEDLAFRLHVIIKNFQHIEQTEIAKTEAEQQASIAKINAAEASAAQKQAESAARQRQVDLMTMTHQLQGPLNPVVASLAALQDSSLPKSAYDELQYARALVENCLTLCWGTSATFANQAGKKVALVADKIDAPAEMRRLCKMLQLSNTDTQLDFRYRQDPYFPTLRNNRAVFTSVLFSLIHNAMKYADRQSTVNLECTFERNTAEAALKVKSVGVPIFPEETDDIFKQFKRGKALDKTSLIYDGTGLGLWVARELMLSVGGDLTVELSREHRRLSVFVVHLPGGLSHVTGALPQKVAKTG